MKSTALTIVLLLTSATSRAAPSPPRPVEPPASSDESMGRRIQDALRAHGADIHGCYGIALAERADVAGELLVRLWVAPAPRGNVDKAEILKDEVGSGRLASCLADAMRHWSLPELAGDPAEGARQIVFPLAFRPDESAPRRVIAQSDGKPGALPGGKLEARVLVSSLTVGATQASLTRLTLKPSARLSIHHHPSLELLWVVKGIVRLRVGKGGAPQNAEAGDLILVPPGRGHNLEAAPLAPAELVQLFVPAGPELAYLDPTKKDGTLPGEEKQIPGAPIAKIVKLPSLKPLPILGGAARATLYLDGEALGASVQRFEADAGAKVPAHQHDTSDEILYVVSGAASLTIAGHSYAIAAGDAIHIPMKTQHALEVKDKLVAVQCYAPAGPEQRFKAPPPAPEKK